jgi:hypothetical protein
MSGDNGSAQGLNHLYYDATTKEIKYSTTSVTPASSGVPYTGATSAVNLGAYDLTVNGITVGKGAGNISTNTATGVSALLSNTMGAFNTANGSFALKSNTTGAFNTANGATALESNITGINNTANGSYALYSNTEGSHNTANGASTLYNNITGGANTAIGLEALYYNTTGNNNTASGASALYRNTTGINNTANGTSALQNNTEGRFNTATGLEALNLNTTGEFNTAIGSPALSTNTTGSQNTAVGSFADVSVDNLTNATAIGYGAVVNASNKIQLGNSSVTSVSTNGVLSASGLVLKTATLGPADASNYNVSGVGILFLVPTDNYILINGFSGGVIGQILHLVVSNPPDPGPYGITLVHNSVLGTQKIVCGSTTSIDYNGGVTLVFDGTYWRLLKSGGGS